METNPYLYREEDQQTQTTHENPNPNPNPNPNRTHMLIIRLMSKRRTWVALFVIVYGILIYSSWNILKAILVWYKAALSPSSPEPKGWLAALYASLMLGAVFGVMSMVAALSVAVPAMLVTWITILVLLTFCGKGGRDLVVEGKMLTAEISRLVVKILIKEGNFVAAFCAVLGYFLLVRKSSNDADFKS